MANKKTHEIINDYIIDFDLFTVEEIIKIVNFMHSIEKYKTSKISQTQLKEQYKEYRSILNNKSLEKKYDKMLLKKSGISIYEVMKNII